jgi:hypothetical protein
MAGKMSIIMELLLRRRSSVVVDLSMVKMIDLGEGFPELIPLRATMIGTSKLTSRRRQPSLDGGGVSTHVT